VPVEGHWRRARTPLNRRDKLLLAAVAVVGAVVLVVAITIALAGRGGTSGGTEKCVVVDVPSTMGGARLTQCGSAAHDFCRTEGAKDQIVANACRAQGYAADVP
jgi:hypothetical protein